MNVSMPPVAVPIAVLAGVELKSEVNETQYNGRLFTSQLRVGVIVGVDQQMGTVIGNKDIFQGQGLAPVPLSP